MLGYGRVAVKYKYEKPRMLRELGYFGMGIGKMHWHPQRNLHGFHKTLIDESGRCEVEGFISDYRAWFKEVAPDKDPDVTGIGWNENVFGAYALPEELHPTRWTGNTAVETIKNYNKDQPLFLKVSFARPHSPYDPPERIVNMYRWEDMPVPVIGDWTDYYRDFEKLPSPYYGDYGVEHAKKARRHYYANITFIDEEIGKIINALKEKNMYDDSLIIFTADHGDMLGDHHHWRKTYPYEGSAGIPMIMKWPKTLETVVERGSILQYPVELRDILPTFLDMAGGEIPDDMDGASMLELVRKKNPKWREYIDLEHWTCYHWGNYWMALTDGKIKYIYFRPTGEERLFDLDKDPGEEKELSGVAEYQEILKLWRERMVKHLEIRGPEWVKDGKLVVQKNGPLYSPNFPVMYTGDYHVDDGVQILDINPQGFPLSTRVPVPISEILEEYWKKPIILEVDLASSKSSHQGTFKVNQNENLELLLQDGSSISLLNLFGDYKKGPLAFTLIQPSEDERGAGVDYHFIVSGM